MKEGKVSVITIVLLLFSVFLWGSSFTLIRSAIKYYSPGELAFLRFFIASILLFFVLVFSKSKLPKLYDIFWFLLCGLIGISFYHITLNAGEKSITAGTAGFVASTTPVFTAILGYFFLKEKIKVISWVGLAISMIGVGLISLSENISGEFNIGSLLVLLSALSGSIYVIFQTKLLKRYSALEVAAYSILAGTLFLLYYAPDVVNKAPDVPFQATIEVIYLGIFPAALAYLIWTYILPKFPNATLPTTYLYLIPVVSLCFAYLWIHEIPTIYQISGGFITLAGIVLSNFRLK